MFQSLIQIHVRQHLRVQMGRVVVNGVVADMVLIFVVKNVCRTVRQKLNVENTAKKKRVR
jgi:hypothetical protein